MKISFAVSLETSCILPIGGPVGEPKTSFTNPSDVTTGYNTGNPFRSSRGVDGVVPFLGFSKGSVCMRGKSEEGGGC